VLLGGTGGIGSVAYKLLSCSNTKKIFVPTSKELDLSTNFLTVDFALKYKDVDLIINCAGIAEKDEHPLYINYDKIMNINFKSNLLLVEFAKHLRNRHNRQINLVVISSSSATKGREGTTIYSASKSALHSLVESQSEELAKQDIFINCICPEKVMTNMLRNLGDKSDSSEVLSTKEAAKAILSYCDTREHGQIIHIRKGMKI
jgi:short-subunit dehydrogenase